MGHISENLNCNSNSLGFRVPDLRLARDFLMETGPLATTSANISGKKSCKNMDDIIKDLSSALEKC